MRVLYFSGRMPDENSGGGSSNLPGTTKKWGSPSNFITLTRCSRSRWTKCGEPFNRPGGERVDAADLKSSGPKGPCGFESHPGHNMDRIKETS